MNVRPTGWPSPMDRRFPGCDHQRRFGHRKSHWVWIGSRAIAPITAAGTDFLLTLVFSYRARTLALPETQTKPVPFDRIILLWAKQTNAPRKGKQDMETKCGRFTEWFGHDDMARVGFEHCRDYATR